MVKVFDTAAFKDVRRRFGGCGSGIGESDKISSELPVDGTLNEWGPLGPLTGLGSK